jgi:hypothetical protein
MPWWGNMTSVQSACLLLIVACMAWVCMMLAVPETVTHLSTVVLTCEPVCSSLAYHTNRPSVPSCPHLQFEGGQLPSSSPGQPRPTEAAQGRLCCRLHPGALLPLPLEASAISPDHEALAVALPCGPSAFVPGGDGEQGTLTA